MQTNSGYIFLRQLLHLYHRCQYWYYYSTNCKSCARDQWSTVPTHPITFFPPFFFFSFSIFFVFFLPSAYIIKNRYLFISKLSFWWVFISLCLVCCFKICVICQEYYYGCFSKFYIFLLFKHLVSNRNKTWQQNKPTKINWALTKEDLINSLCYSSSKYH